MLNFKVIAVVAASIVAMNACKTPSSNSSAKAVDSPHFEARMEQVIEAHQFKSPQMIQVYGKDSDRKGSIKITYYPSSAGNEEEQQIYNVFLDRSPTLYAELQTVHGKSAPEGVPNRVKLIRTGDEKSGTFAFDLYNNTDPDKKDSYKDITYKYIE